MQKIYSKSKLLVLIFSLFLSASFYSCKKDCNCNCDENGNGNGAETCLLNGTTWKSDSFEVTLSDPKYFSGDEYLVKFEKIIISFELNKATIDIYVDEIYDPLLGATYKNLLVRRESRSYTCESGKVTLTLEADNVWISEQIWTGKIEGDKMTLNNVFGKTVVFKKE